MNNKVSNINSKDFLYTTVMNRKRKNIDNNNVVCKKPRIIDWNKMISASSIRNYMLNDPLLDWLNYYNINTINCIPRAKDHNIITHSHHNAPDTHTNFIMDQGIVFEKKVFDMLKNNKFSIIQIAESNQSHSVEMHNMTIDMMRQGIDIIYQGVIHDYTAKLYGSPDLLIRSDKFKEIFNYDIMNKNIKAPKLGTKFHYVVVDIKHSTLHFNCNKEYLQNVNCIPAYKGQILIYNKILGNIQGYVPRCGYMLGKRSIYTKNKQLHIDDDFMTNIGMIDYKGFDKHYNFKLTSAIEWITRMRKEGGTWQLLPNPSTIELYPNMKNDKDGHYRKIKNEIAENLHEITNIWWCGYNKRLLAHSKNIYSWNDKRLNSEILELGNSNIGITLDHILNINRQHKLLIRVDDLHKSIDRQWKDFGNDTMEFYIDFETLNCNIGQVNINGKSDIIFMIGLGWIENNNWNFKSFTINNNTNEDEYNMFISMWEHVDSITNKMNKTNPVFMHWSNAELTFYKKVQNKSFGYLPNMHFYDLYKLFIDNNIVVKDALNFSLKSIGNAMYKNKLITTYWNNTQSICMNGLDAMYLAHNIYNNKTYDENIIENPTMKEIIHYNMIDCKIMWNILTYLRTTS
jgi:hypothetical protein